MPRPRLLTIAQWQEVERRVTIHRRHCYKKIAADLGITVSRLYGVLQGYRAAGINGRVKPRIKLSRKRT